MSSLYNDLSLSLSCHMPNTPNFAKDLGRTRPQYFWAHLRREDQFDLNWWLLPSRLQQLPLSKQKESGDKKKKRKKRRNQEREESFGCVESWIAKGEHQQCLLSLPVPLLQLAMDGYLDTSPAFATFLLILDAALACKQGNLPLFVVQNTKDTYKGDFSNPRGNTKFYPIKWYFRIPIKNHKISLHIERTCCIYRDTDEGEHMNKVD